jgi:hypothetical protein
MQIPPSNSLLQALSRQADPASAPRPQTTPDAAREAARAVFAQIRAVPKPAAAPAPAIQSFAPSQPAPQTQGYAPNTTTALPAAAPTKPLPRGSFLNILV